MVTPIGSTHNGCFEIAVNASENLGIEEGGSYPYPTIAELSVIRAAYDNFFNVVETKVTDDGNVAMFSRTTATKEAYESRIDELFDGGKPSYGLKSAVVLDRSDILDLLGYGDKPLYLNEGKVIQGQKKHENVTAEVWKKVPEWIENPALVFDSDPSIPKNIGRLVFIAPEMINGWPVRIIIEPDADSKGLKVDLLINAYDAIGSVPFKEWVQDKNLLRYYDKAKSPAILARSRLQLSSLAQARSSKGKILRDTDLVKYRAENTAFSRGESKGLPIETVETIVNNIKSNWTKVPPITVVENMRDERIPKRVRDYDMRLKANGSTGNPVAFISDGKVFILSSMVKDTKAVHEALFHEVLGHYGLRGTYGTKLEKILDNIAVLRKEQVIQKSKDYFGKKFNEPDNIRRAAEEVLAELAQTKPDLNFVKRAVAAIRNFLRDIGFDVELSDNDIIAKYLLPARAYVENGGNTFKDQLKSLKASYSRSNEAAPTFYSQLTRAFMGAKQQSMPATQWEAWLKGNAAQLGVKADEIQWSGINEYLNLQTGKVDKQAIVDYLDANGVQVSEAMLGESNTYPQNSYAHPDTGEVDSLESWRSQTEDFSEDGGPTIEEQLEDLIDVSGDVIPDEGTDAKYSGYTVPGGKNYKELLLTLPKKDKRNSSPSTSVSSIVANDKDWVIEFDDGSVKQFPLSKADDKVEAVDYALNQKNPVYQSSHFDQPNILAHVRFDERTDADGNKVLFIQEIQSDWGQKGKKSGFKDANAQPLTKQEMAKRDEYEQIGKRNLSSEDVIEYDRLIKKSGEYNSTKPVAAPFVTDTKAWVALSIKRMTRYAVDNGFDKVAFING